MTEIWNLSAICRCCHVDGNFRSLELPYAYQNDVEVYSVMLQETLGVEIYKTTKDESYSICYNCIERLREAVNFKLQINACERKFREYLQNEEALNSKDIKIELDVDSDPADGSSSLILELEVPELIKHEAGNDSDNDNYEDFEDNTDINGKDQVKEEIIKKEETKDKVKNEKKISVPKTRAKKATKQRITRKTPKKQFPKELSASKPLTDPPSKKINRKFCQICQKTFNKQIEMNIHMNVYHACRGPYTCISCLVETEQFEQMHEHVQTHNTNKVKCRFCDKQFLTKDTLTEHENTVHARASVFICNICNKRFCNRSTIRKHLLWHEGLNKKFFCHLCGLGINDRSNLKIHIETVHYKLRKFHCTECDKSFAAKKHLKHHTQVTHSGIKPYRCDLCPAQYSDRKSYIHHCQTIHNVFKSTTYNVSKARTYYCKGCPETFNNRGRFQSHVIKHNKAGTLPHICHICGKGFSCKYSLNRHVDIHAGKKPHSCDICQKKFSHKNQVIRHKRNVHNPIKIEKIKCPICKNNVRDLEKHKQIHITRPYACEICHRSYPQKNALNRHVKEFHLGIRKYYCSICDIKYRQGRHLERHNKRFHTDIKTDNIVPVDYDNSLPVPN